MLSAGRPDSPEHETELWTFSVSTKKTSWLLLDDRREKNMQTVCLYSWNQSMNGTFVFA